MKLRPLNPLRHPQLIGIFLIFVGVVAWMRLSSFSTSNVRAFRNRDALVSSFSTRRTKLVSTISRTKLVSTITGTLSPSAKSADVIEVWTIDKVTLAKLRPSRDGLFSGTLKQSKSSDLAIVAKSGGRLLAVMPGNDVEDFTNVVIGERPNVTFSTQFVDENQMPVNVTLDGYCLVGRVRVPIDPVPNLVVHSGSLTVSGLPPNGFITLRILNPEFANSTALYDIALRSGPNRYFPTVKVGRSNQIVGQVRDVNGKPAANVIITIKSNIRRLKIPAVHTDHNGTFVFDRLPNGVFSIQGVSDGRSNKYTYPISNIRCGDGKRIVLPVIHFHTGKFVDFVVNASRLNNRQPIVLEISGGQSESRWTMTKTLLPGEKSRILIPNDVVSFRASQQPHNGILPSVRNISITPRTFDPHRAVTQTVTIQILK